MRDAVAPRLRRWLGFAGLALRARRDAVLGASVLAVLLAIWASRALSSANDTLIAWVFLVQWIWLGAVALGGGTQGTVRVQVYRAHALPSLPMGVRERRVVAFLVDLGVVVLLGLLGLVLVFGVLRSGAVAAMSRPERVEVGARAVLTLVLGAVVVVAPARLGAVHEGSWRARSPVFLGWAVALTGASMVWGWRTLPTAAALAPLWVLAPTGATPAPVVAPGRWRARVVAWASRRRAPRLGPRADGAALRRRVVWAVVGLLAFLVPMGGLTGWLAMLGRASEEARPVVEVAASPGELVGVGVMFMAMAAVIPAFGPTLSGPVGGLVGAPARGMASDLLVYGRHLPLAPAWYLRWRLRETGVGTALGVAAAAVLVGMLSGLLPWGWSLLASASAAFAAASLVPTLWCAEVAWELGRPRRRGATLVFLALCTVAACGVLLPFLALWLLGGPAVLGVVGGVLGVWCTLAGWVWREAARALRVVDSPPLA